MPDVRDQIKNAEPSLAAAMRALYASEINCRIQSFWDGGWTVSVGGDELAGWRVEQQFASEQFDQIPGWLVETAKKEYPDSDLARA
jgi:hypothetical protein